MDPVEFAEHHQEKFGAFKHTREEREIRKEGLQQDKDRSSLDMWRDYLIDDVIRSATVLLSYVILPFILTGFICYCCYLDPNDIEIILGCVAVVYYYHIYVVAYLFGRT